MSTTNRTKKVALEFSGADAIVMERGTEPVKSLPDSFEVRAQGDQGFRCIVRLMRQKTAKGAPIKDQFTADISLTYAEDIKEWR